MARPPRIPVYLRPDQEVIYNLTLCVRPRRPVLANDAAWTNILATLRRLDRWLVQYPVVMPDHLHMLAGPLDRDASVTDFLKWFKRWFNEVSGQPAWKWQPGGFDRLLRSDESKLEKWHYLRENPVRAGLVADWHDWPYRYGFEEDEYRPNRKL